MGTMLLTILILLSIGARIACGSLRAVRSHQTVNSKPNYAAGKGTTFLLLPTPISPFWGRKFSSHEFNSTFN
jgi:hypothetical protein